jgi:hypothetical protein
MKKLFLTMCFLLGACAPSALQTPTPLPSEPTFLSPETTLASPSSLTLDANAAEARDVMLRYFTALNTGDYAGAGALYGGSYETLTTWNPDVSPTDLTTLWEHACERNGLQCLEVLEVVSEEQVSANVMKFRLHFRNPDGTLFVLGPCCGENATDMPPVTDFECDVARNSSGEFKVLCLPPYVP